MFLWSIEDKWLDLGYLYPFNAQYVTGLSVLSVWKSAQSVDMKRYLGIGYAAVENPIFFNKNNTMPWSVFSNKQMKPPRLGSGLNHTHCVGHCTGAVTLFTVYICLSIWKSLISSPPSFPSLQNTEASFMLGGYSRYWPLLEYPPVTGLETCLPLQNNMILL